MSLLSTLKSILGLGGSKRKDEQGTTVTVERESGPSADRADSGTPVGGTDDVSRGEGESATHETAEATGGHEDGDAEPAATAGGDATDEPEGSSDPVDSISGIGPAYAERLAAIDIETVADLASADAAAVADATDIPESRVADWIERAGAT